MQFSTPAVLASLVSVAYNLVARIFVAKRFGMDGCRAHGFISSRRPVFSDHDDRNQPTIIISIRLGERNNDKAEGVRSGAPSFGGNSRSFIFFGHLFGPNFALCRRDWGAADELCFSLAKSYISVIIWGVFAAAPSRRTASKFLRAEGKPLIAMVSMFLSAIVNIVLDYYFLLVRKTGVCAGLAERDCERGRRILDLLPLLFRQDGFALRWALYLAVRLEAHENDAICGRFLCNSDLFGNTADDAK